MCTILAQINRHLFIFITRQYLLIRKSSKPHLLLIIIAAIRFSLFVDFNKKGLFSL